MQEFESFLFTRGPLARAFDDVLAAPIPERLLAAVRDRRRSTSATAARVTAAVLLARLADMFRMPAFSPAVAIPAVLVAPRRRLACGTALHPDPCRRTVVAL